MSRLIVALIAVTMAGCAARAPTQEQLLRADYGPYPHNYQDLITSHMRAVLKDPESARFGFVQAPVKSWYPLDTRVFGWAVCAGVNARNSFGGYTGTQQNYFLINNGAIIKAEYGRDAEVIKACPVRS